MNKKKLVSILLLVVLILGLPASIYLIRQQQIIKSRATAVPIEFVVDNQNVVQKSDGSKAAISPRIKIKLTPRTLRSPN